MATIGQLHLALPHERDVVATRIFAAPRRLVWELLTRPNLLRRWLFGPPGWSMVACDNDLQAGASFRWSWRGPEGEELVMSGRYQEVVAPERMVRTESCTGACKDESATVHATLNLAEQSEDDEPSKTTTLTLTLRHESRDARDAALSSGMPLGMAAAYDRLALFLAQAVNGRADPAAA